jgi:isoleucyl-tRNA synthetase
MALPFENSELFEKAGKADYISEAVDQTRGWFYTLHAVSTLLFDRPAFENVISVGHILDARGEKMSKSRGNVVDPWILIDLYGADAIRWYMWILSELHTLVLGTGSMLEAHDRFGPTQSIQRFTDELSNWYVRRSRRRFWKASEDEDKAAAYQTLYTCLTTLVRVLAPRRRAPS